MIPHSKKEEIKKSLSYKCLDLMRSINSPVLTDMDITTYYFVTKTATSGGIFTELEDNVYEDDYEDVDPFHVLFMATDQGFKIDRELIEEDFHNALTEKKIGYMCANDYDVFNLIEKETVCYFPKKK